MFLGEEKIRSTVSLLPPWAIKLPEQSVGTTHLFSLPFLLISGAIQHLVVTQSSAQVPPVPRSWGKAPLTPPSVKTQGDHGQQELQNVE